MADKTHIEWTDATWNPVTGCSKVSQGCKFCYAERDWARLSANRNTRYFGRAFTDVACHDSVLVAPLHWRKSRRIFVNSMSDLFHEAVPNAFIERVLTITVHAKQHTFQILTKRPQRMHDVMRRWTDMNGRAQPNLWLGVSVEDQTTADERIHLLLRTPAAVRWISAEPLLGQINVGPYLSRTNMPGLRMMPGFSDPLPSINWVVSGGESGSNARPSHPDWFRSLRDQCQAAGVPFLFKQWGEWAPHSPFAGGDEGGDLRRGTVRYLMGSERVPDGRFLKGDAAVRRVGKKLAGRMLDGVVHNEFPR